MKDKDITRTPVVSGHSVKKTIRLSAETAATIKELGSSPLNWSGGVNDVAYRYKLLINDNLPALTQYEEIAINKALKNHKIEHKEVEDRVKSLHVHVINAMSRDTEVATLLGKDYDMDAETFLKSKQSSLFSKKVKCWNFSQRMAVLHKAMAHVSK